MPNPDADGAKSVAGRFRLGELLSGAASAYVLGAVDTHTGTPLAMKIPHPHLSERPVAREAFLDVARVLDVGFEKTEVGSVAWIALERAEGRSVSELVASDEARAPADAVAVIHGVLRALDAAHRIGLVRRDLSPANIMVSPTAAGPIDVSGVRLFDFGLADAAGASTFRTGDPLNVTATPVTVFEGAHRRSRRRRRPPPCPWRHRRPHRSRCRRRGNNDRSVRSQDPRHAPFADRTPGVHIPGSLWPRVRDHRALFLFSRPTRRKLMAVSSCPEALG